VQDRAVASGVLYRTVETSTFSSTGVVRLSELLINRTRSQPNAITCCYLVSSKPLLMAVNPASGAHRR